MSCGSLEEDESEDSGIAVMAFGKDKVFNVFENSMNVSLQLVALYQDWLLQSWPQKDDIVYKMPDVKKKKKTLGEENLGIDTGKLMW